jgi:hypothetical protein
MMIVEIKNVHEIPCRKWHGFVAEPSVENAVAQYKERYGNVPDKVFFKREKSGRCAVYIPMEECEE